MKLLPVYFAANGPRKLINGFIPTAFCHKKQKEDRENEIPAQVFSCEFREIFKNTFF